MNRVNPAHVPANQPSRAPPPSQPNGQIVTVSGAAAEPPDLDVCGFWKRFWTVWLSVVAVFFCLGALIWLIYSSLN